MITLRISWRLLRRDIRAGEIRVLLGALVLAVAAVSSVGFVTDRAARALDLQANALLGGDAVLRADRAVDPAVRAQAAQLGLQHTEVRNFPSMLRVGEKLQLSELRAMDAGFPLRGEFRIRTVEDGPVARAEGIPARGEVWLTRAGASRLQAALGDTVQVGSLPLRLTALVIDEPDAALDYFNVAPRAFFNLQDLPATGLDQLGSRIAHRIVVAGEPGAVEQWVKARRSERGRGQRIETAADARPEIRSALDRADRFLGLAALVAVVLAGIAVAMAARRHVEHHLDGCAVMRCLGASQRTVLAIYGGELFWLGLLGSVLGLAVAYALQALLGDWLQQMLGLPIPGAGWMPALQGAAVAFAVLLGFALPPVLALRQVSAMRVLRRDIGIGSPSAWLSALLGIGGLGALLWWKAGSPTLAAIMLGGLAATFACLAALALLLVWSLRRMRHRLSGVWRYGLAGLGRRGAGSVVQVTALGLGLMVILLLSLVQNDLISRWQDALPADAPNRFLVNVQPDQVEAVTTRLREAGVVDPQLYPMVRGRLVAVNGEAVTGRDYRSRGERARRLAEREFNLSWAATLRDDNRVVAGQFWPATGPAETELSVEEGLANSLGWKLGDQIRFDLAGTPVEGRISSLRKVDWESFKPNFFVLISPGVLQAMPASHIGAVHVPAGRQPAIDALVRDFPNLSVIDIEAILAQVRRTADQVSKAVEYVFYFTLAAGLLVLVAAISATQDERLLEGGVMRAFGASRAQLRGAHLAEFAAIGLLAGATAALAATVVSGVISVQVFNLDWVPDWRLAAVGGGLGVLLVSLTGLWATRSVVAAPPAVTLRALQG